MVLRAGDAEEEGALLAFDLGSDGHQFDLLMTPAVSRAERSSGQASNYFRMDGKAVFGQAVTQMSDSVRRVLDRVGWQASTSITWSRTRPTHAFSRRSPTSSTFPSSEW